MDKLLKFNNKLIKSDNRIICEFEKPIYNVNLFESNYGSITAYPMSGYAGTMISLSNTPNTDCSFSQYNLTGGVLTGNEFVLNNDVSAQGVFSRNVHSITTQTDGHGTITATPTTGYSGTTVSLSNTPSNNYVFNNYSITGATLTGNQFKIQTNDITAKANFKTLYDTLYLSDNTIHKYTGPSYNNKLDVHTTTTSNRYDALKFNYVDERTTTDPFRRYLNVKYNNQHSWQIIADATTALGYIRNAIIGTTGFITASNNVSSLTLTGYLVHKTISSDNTITYKIVRDREAHRMSGFINNSYCGYKTVSMYTESKYWSSFSGFYLGCSGGNMTISNIQLAGFNSLANAVQW